MGFVKTPRPRLKLERKYTPGETIVSIAAFQEAVANREWIFLWGRTDKAQHSCVAANQQFGQVARMLREGRIRRAVRNPDAPYVFNAVWDSTILTETWYARCDELGATVTNAKTARALIKKCRALIPVGARLQVVVTVLSNDPELR